MESGPHVHGGAGPRAPAGAKRDFLRSRVSVVEDRILLTREIPVQSPLTISTMFERVEELSKGWDYFAHIVDLREAAHPDAETRLELRRLYRSLSPRIRLLAVIIQRKGNNVILFALARLLAHTMQIEKVSLFESYEDALEAARRVLH